MSEEHTTLAPFYKGWDNYQQLLSKAIEPLSADQLALRAAPSLRSIGELASHIIAARAGWFHGIMQEGWPDMEAFYTWDDEGTPARKAAELVSGLDATWNLMQDCLGRWTAADLGQTFLTRYYKERSRQWIIWHIIEHDLHHGGELSFTLGMHSLAAPDL